ncbi:MAG: M20/M25/M40 family metallo-hydrolase [Dactylosporangium sp.]|nr:M20/M25/M40 family metallo-hydrolase [Dactylosporangium sp.]NNJ62124.1 M20/M25/M40 family metallo-hydrolase [Dactylosporangium sp.]
MIASIGTTAAAAADHAGVLALAQDLVRLPSRAGIDPYELVLSHTEAWLAAHTLPSRRLLDTTGATVGLTCEVTGTRPGPRWVLDACLDTAPFGDEIAWTHPPTCGTIADGWLWGRGAADSKTGAAIFCHIAARLAADPTSLRGSLVLLLDVDEHTGAFGGATRYFAGSDAPDDVAGVMIGYPGLDKLVVGGRGVLRARLHVHGVASHTGGRTSSPNAIEKAAHLVNQLAAADLNAAVDPTFPLPGKLTVTAITGGQGYSITPDLCTVAVDIRTTRGFDDTAALELLHTTAARVDGGWPATGPTHVQIETRWPAYALPPDSTLRTAILDAAQAHGVVVPASIAGPSNIGNYLAGLAIPATAGFGVTYRALHATDERIRIDTIPIVQAIYYDAILRLMGSR